jgi:transposase
MIRIDAAWLATAPLDMRAGTDSALARVITVFGVAHPHHAYLFANKRANRLKILVHDGIGIWLAARRLHQGKFVWASRLRLTHCSPGARSARRPGAGLTLAAWAKRASSPWCESSQKPA